ncbi:hypothetical protein [Lacticaseibacillus zhaodongensis]|uniref:hypothetical protein n=1 Tax=Lacticaseibacillus zhaodongensis TaxID=2668065 RepID=UPI0012D2D868|nr:hypothetical protein [Lacticaseibacillus zhaodongensis]
MLHALTSLLINSLGIAVLIIPLWLLTRNNKTISMVPLDSSGADDERRFYTNVWFYETAKLKIMNGEAYQVGATVGTPNGQRFTVEEVDHFRRCLGMQNHFELTVHVQTAPIA